MQAVALKKIASQIESLSVADRIATIELILQTIKKAEPKIKKVDWLNETFSLMDKNLISLSEKKWTRSDLYTRGM